MGETLSAIELDYLTGLGQSSVGDGDGSAIPPGGSAPVVFTFPNLITLAGYAAGLAWLAGASPVWALLSIVADELDGHIARETGEESAVGAELDSSVDLILNALVGMRLGVWWALPATLAVQVYQKEIGWKPVVGSSRAAAMIYAIAKGV